MKRRNMIKTISGGFLGFLGFFAVQKKATADIRSDFLIFPLESMESKLIRDEGVYKIWEKTVICAPGESPFNLQYATNSQGDYIGTEEDAEYLCKEMGIFPQLVDHSKKVCTVGFSPKKNKYYGWSNRAIFGFDCNYKIEDGSFLVGKLYEWEVGYSPKTFDECRLMAEYFADAVN